LSATVGGGLPVGVYRVCTMTSASNHQPVLMPVSTTLTMGLDVTNANRSLNVARKTIARSSPSLIRATLVKAIRTGSRMLRRLPRLRVAPHLVGDVAVTLLAAIEGMISDDG